MPNKDTALLNKELLVEVLFGHLKHPLVQKQYE